MLLLIRSLGDVPFPFGHSLFGRGIVMNATRPATIGDVIVAHDGGPLHDRTIDVSSVHNMFIHAHDGCVVDEVMTAPHTSGEPNAHVSKSIIDAAIIPDVRSPIPFMEDIEAIRPPPVSGGPKNTFRGRHYPCTGNPVIAIRPIGPIAGRPKEARLRARRLFIDGQDRWSEVYRNKYTCGRRQSGDRYGHPYK